ncbi:TraB/GumN family protein [Allorhizobium terrae]|nr:TraB/GumN family protein [Allorhizobium terrae]
MMKPFKRAYPTTRKGQWIAAMRNTLSMILALGLALLFSSATTQAQTPSDHACTGKNLLPELQQRDPQAYAKVAAEAAKTPNGQAIFWKIEKPGLKPSYLLGTMHVTDPRVLTMPDGAQTAANAAATIIVESDEVLDDKKAAIALMAKPELSMFTDGSTITSHLTPEQVKTLEAGLKKRGLALAAVNRMKPWIIASFVALPACELARKAEGVSFLDKRIAQDAAKAGKRVMGLETYAEQLAALNDLPMAFHLKSLIETLQLGDRMNDVNETMIDLYLKGDIGAIVPMLEAVSPEPSSTKDPDYAAFEQRIVLDRNKIMAARAAPTLNQGNVFMAVGALHLPGKAGLVALLRQQGFTVTAMP